MTQDIHQQAIERFQDAADDVRDEYAKMRLDMRFSDPTGPEQWNKDALDLRNGRPCLTFDRTNQFIGQIVNAGRQNKPGIQCLPASGDAAIEVAEKLEGIVRHIEYISRAGIAYDTALENAARVGLGWLRVVPEIMRPESNEQEIRIKRILDPLSCYLEAGWTEPDGSDAMFGFIETSMTDRAFKARWPKAKSQAWEGADQSWFGDKQTRVCEYICIKESKVNRLSISMEGQSTTMSEEEYWQLRQQTGMAIPAMPFTAKTRAVKWYQLSGAEVLEETDFPSQLLPLIPVIGHELWVDGRRHLGGMTRRLMDSQRAYNYERSAFIESMAMQPKAPFLASIEALDGHEDAWGALNKGNPAVIPFNAYDEEGKVLPMPQRVAPPAFPTAFAQGGQIASQDMEASVGIYHANLGAPSQAISGRAKREDKVAGDTANFHYLDNLHRSIEQMGRVIVDMIPRVYDTPRQARIVGMDETHDFVHVDPGMKQPTQMRGKKVTAINPGMGSYDVRIKSGPAYTTLREESAEQLANMMQAAPQLMPILGDLWIGMQDWPEAEKARKRLQLMLPPQIQQAEQDDDEQEPLPPQVEQAIREAAAHIQQLEQALQMAQSEVKTHMQAKELEAKSRESIARNAEDTKRYVAELNSDTSKDVGELKALLELVLAGLAAAPPALGKEVDEDLAEPKKAESSGGDALAMLAQITRALNPPKRKTMAIQAPSGAMYHGQVTEEAMDQAPDAQPQPQPQGEPQ